MPGIVRWSVSQFGYIADREIAVVFDVKPKSVEQGEKTGGAQSRGAHQGPAL
jgi:hypothetical protein